MAMQRIASWTVAFAVAATTWAVAVLSAAWLVTHRPAGDFGWAVGAFTYAAGSVVCHQRPERSFEVGGQPFPVCARCTGIYAGAALTAVVLFTHSTARARAATATAPLGTRAARIASVVAIVPTLATVGYEWTTGDTSSNIVRAVAGLPLGALVSWMITRTTSL